jgi:hypothetical protein
MKMNNGVPDGSSPNQDQPMQLMVNVPPDQADAVNSWEDGKSYDVTVKQTGPMQFDLVKVDGENTDDEESEDEGEPETSEGGSKNPAIAIVMASKKPQ